MSQLIAPGTSLAYANFGRWVADCSYFCGGAAELARFADGFTCDECQRATDVQWPPGDMVESIERLLLMRPHRKNQNWIPGETIHDLLQENADHGILTELARSLSDDSPALVAVGDRLTIDNLPMLNPRRELVR